jgi:hypothetical protein
VGTEISIVVDSNTVNECIGRLKGRKAPGCDGIMSEHLMFSHPVISYALPKHFRAMLVHAWLCSSCFWNWYFY